MVIIPLYVKNQDELKKATSLKRNVIVITDGDLFQEVQKNKKKYKVKKGIGKFGILGSIGIFTAGLFAPEVVVPLVIAGSVGSLTAGVWGNFSAFLHKELKNYTLSLDEKNRVLLLINEKKIKIKYDGNISIEGYANFNEKAKIIAPVYVNNLEKLKFNAHEERECIIVEADLYKKIKAESKYGPSFWGYGVYDSKKNMQRIYINRKKCDLETCKIEGVDMNSILLEKCGWKKIAFLLLKMMVTSILLGERFVVVVKQYDELVKAVKNKEEIIYAVESAYRKIRHSYKYYGELTGKPAIRNHICWMATGQEGAMIMNDYMDFRVRRIKKKLGDELEGYTIQLNKEEKRIELTRKK